MRRGEKKATQNGKFRNKHVVTTKKQGSGMEIAFMCMGRVAEVNSISAHDATESIPTSIKS